MLGILASGEQCGNFRWQRHSFGDIHTLWVVSHIHHRGVIGVNHLCQLPWALSYLGDSQRIAALYLRAHPDGSDKVPTLLCTGNV